MDRVRVRKGQESSESDAKVQARTAMAFRTLMTAGRDDRRVGVRGMIAVVIPVPTTPTRCRTVCSGAINLTTP